jgi:DNA-binding HxlR family transcriptional regulator
MSWEQLLEEKSSLATALDLVGDRWSMMILSGCLASVCRFNQFEQHLGINRNLLSKRLNKLIAAGLIEKHLYQEKPKRYEYTITSKALELRPVIVGLAAWGEKHFTKDQAPFTMIHDDCGGELNIQIQCNKCTNHVTNKDVSSRINPGAGKASMRVYTNLPLINIDRD